MVVLQPQLWIESASAAVEFYSDAFGATVLHCVGEGDDIVAQLSLDGAGFWVVGVDGLMGRFSPIAIGGTTGRLLVVVEDPDAMVSRASAAGGTVTSPVQDEHGWRIGRIVDPFGHEWEIGHPLETWPPG